MSTSRSRGPHQPTRVSRAQPRLRRRGKTLRSAMAGVSDSRSARKTTAAAVRLTAVALRCLALSLLVGPPSSRPANPMPHSRDNDRSSSRSPVHTAGRCTSFVAWPMLTALARASTEVYSPPCCAIHDILRPLRQTAANAGAGSIFSRSSSTSTTIVIPGLYRPSRRPSARGSSIRF